MTSNLRNTLNMLISTVTFTNYRCFGPEPTTIALDRLTAFVGTNGSGKTAVLAALAHVFGITTQERRLRRSDFHVPRGQDPDAIETLTLTIELRIAFPELATGESTNAVPECFNQMLLTEPGGDPFCRVRLVGTWTRSNLPEGDVEEQVSWIHTPDNEVTDEDLKPLRAAERSRIHVLYVPATRDPGQQLRNVAGTLLARVLAAVRWSTEARDQVSNSARATTEKLRTEAGVALLEQLISARWGALQDDARVGLPRFDFVRGRLEDVLRRVELAFGDLAESQDLDRLSDGQRSLFYFALVAAVFDFETRIQSDSAFADAIDPDRLDPPVFTVFAIEEPENHLAPHYVGRVMALLGEIASTPVAQTVVTSHSASILRRVDPLHVRHFRLNSAAGTTLVRALTLPTDEHEACKYVRQAVQAFPELYFSRLVILGEGDSEEIVLPRIADAHGVVIDTAFISVVPLGGRHVNHFWRLLRDLEIPFVTLLDLDLGRAGAGWGRIAYVCHQLIELGEPREEVLRVKTPAGSGVLSDADLAKMHARPMPTVAVLSGWLKKLERYDVFFAAPLDLDFLMLSTFPDAYRGTVEAGHGPRLPPSGPKRDARLEQAIDAVLGEADDAGGSYDAHEKERLVWYGYLFLQQGKPSTHLLALSTLTREELRSGTPEVLVRLLAAATTHLTSGA